MCITFSYCSLIVGIFKAERSLEMTKELREKVTI